MGQPQNLAIIISVIMTRLVFKASSYFCLNIISKLRVKTEQKRTPVERIGVCSEKKSEKKTSLI